MKTVILVGLAAITSGCATKPMMRGKAPYYTICRGQSMGSTIASGEMVLVTQAPFSADAVPVGSIIAAYWEGPGVNVVHRVIRHQFRDGKLVALETKGDGNSWEDRFVTTADRFEGVVMKIKKLENSS